MKNYFRVERKKEAIHINTGTQALLGKFNSIKRYGKARRKRPNMTFSLVMARRPGRFTRKRMKKISAVLEKYGQLFIIYTKNGRDAMK